ncbi:MAG TPA: FAD-dependent oxidoreductase [Gammaproteobacteria bacterium]
MTTCSCRILLLGAGHAHLYTLRRAADVAARGHRLTVVGPGRFWYSGLATGMLGGGYEPAEDRLAVARLLSNSRAQLHEATVDCIDAGRGLVRLADGGELPFDVLSINLGSETVPLPRTSPGAPVYDVKPISNLVRLRKDLCRAFAAAGATPVPVVVAGGGPTGVELAANVAALAARRGAAVSVAIVTPAHRLLEQAPAGAAAAASEALRRRGVAILHGRRVLRVEGAGAVLDDGRVLPCDALVNATGLRPSPVPARSGLPVDDRGALRVDAHLRSIGDPRIFGGGDCIAIEGRPLPMIGVYAVREGPVLFRNLLAAAEGRPLAAFRPQRRYLWILNLGDGTGLAIRGRRWWHGRAAFLLKDAIDRRFLASYRR